MSERLSHRDRSTLAIVASVRGIRAETLVCYPAWNGQTPEAARKHLERLCDQGYLVASALPRGSRVFRLSRKGVALTGAPAAFAGSPSTGIAAEMLAVSSLAWRIDEFLFPTKAEVEGLLASFAAGDEKPRASSRFLLRRVIAATGESELRLEVFLAELRPAEDLARRGGVVLTGLQRSSIFRDLVQARLLALTVAVPSRGVKLSLERHVFGVETSVVVVEALQDLIAH